MSLVESVMVSCFFLALLLDGYLTRAELRTLDMNSYARGFMAAKAEAMEQSDDEFDGDVIRCEGCGAESPADNPAGWAMDDDAVWTCHNCAAELKAEASNG
jgi:hypothetical protein